MSNYTPKSGNSATEEKPVPPVSNTGELTASAKPELSALIDALTFTFGDFVSPEDVMALPGYAGLHWLPMEKGDLGYKQGFFSNGICILYDGHSGMGVHVRMMGQACRFLEGCSAFTGWENFLRSILRYKLQISLDNEAETGRECLFYSAKITRLDVAMDDSTGLLKMDRIRRAIVEDTLVSTYRKKREICDFEKGGQVSGQTLYFGKRDGDSMMRFYDRAAKLGLKEHLVRCELELHDGQARAFAEALIGGAHLGTLTAGIVRRKLEFKAGARPVSAGGSQYRSWEIAEWWAEFLGNVEKMRLGIAPVIRTLQRGKAWMMRQVSALFATILDLEGADFVSDMIFQGREKRPKWQKELFVGAS